jgi:cation:H+ antiporter
MLTLVFFILGFSFLYFGAEFLVKGASRLGVLLGIPKIVIGLTIVSISTSMPEAVLSLIAQVYRGEGDIAIGNIVGSNIANIGLILGFACLMRPQHFSSDVRKFDIIVMLAASLWLFFAIYSGTIGRFSGGLFLLGLVLFLFFQVKRALDHRKNNKREKVHLKVVVQSGGWILLGSVILIVGGELFLKASLAIAHYFNLSERVIGLTLIAIGSSLPELATSVVGVLKKETEIVVGNVIGSNIFNILFVVGSVASISPISVSQTLVLWDIPIMLGFSFILAIFGWCYQWVGRFQGVVLMIGFISFMLVTLWR